MISRKLLSAILASIPSPLLGPPIAPVIILLGQSLNAPRGAATTTGSVANVKMCNGGASSVEWLFAPSNIEHYAHWVDVTSAVDFHEGTGQTPLYGIATKMKEMGASRIYVGDVAIGARTLAILSKGGPLSNLWAMINRLCNFARADGYVPKVIFYSAHGEADASAGTTQASYLSQALEYYGTAQLYAAQAMGEPAYVAPVVLTYSQQQNAGIAGQNDRNIKSAIKQLIEILPTAIDAGGIYHWAMSTDRVHPVESSYVLRGEHIGKLVKEYLVSGIKYSPLFVVSVTLNGATFVAKFNRPVVRDASVGVGEALAPTLAEDGLEWVDNGTQIAILAGSLVYGAETITGTLATIPTGTLAQQTLRIAQQTTTATVMTWPTNHPGSLIREPGQGWASSWTPGYTNYSWAIPQSFTGVTV